MAGAPKTTGVRIVSSTSTNGSNSLGSQKKLKALDALARRVHCLTIVPAIDLAPSTKTGAAERSVKLSHG